MMTHIIYDSYLTWCVAVLSLFLPILLCLPIIKYVFLTRSLGHPHLSSCFFTQIAALPTLILTCRCRLELILSAGRAGRRSRSVWYRLLSGRAIPEFKITYFRRDVCCRLKFGVKIWMSHKLVLNESYIWDLPFLCQLCI